MIAVIYASFFTVILMLGVAIIGWFFYRRWTSGKIICFIFNKERHIYRIPLKPDSQDMLTYKNRKYFYNESAVLYTPGFLLKEPTPALLFAEEVPDPVNMFALEEDSGGYSEERQRTSATELSSILDTKMVQDFVQAQSAIQPKQMLTSIFIIGGALAVLMIGGFYYMLQQLGPTIGGVAGG